MKSRQGNARLVGALYVAMALPAAISLTYFPSRFVVPSDPAATAARIESAKLLYRLCVLIDVTSGFFVLCMAVAVYQLFKDVDRTQARLVVGMLFVQSAMAFAVMMAQLAPLVVLNGASYWSAFDKPQLDALAQGFLSLRSQGIGALSIYWGLWLLPLGVLTYKSGFLPRILGVFLLIAGSAYVLSAISFFLLPAYYPKIFWGAAPIYGLGEISFITYLLIKGARPERLQAA
jgi:hypothetical protein